MSKDSPEEESRAPGSGGGGGAGKGGSRRNRADDNVTILTSSMDFYRAGRSRASSSSLTSSVELSSSSLETSIQTRIFKIIVIGDSNVGKTCLTFRFTGGSFPDKTEATIGVDFREKPVEIEGETIKVKELPPPSSPISFSSGDDTACCFISPLNWGEKKQFHYISVECFSFQGWMQEEEEEEVLCFPKQSRSMCLQVLLDREGYLRD